MKNNQISIIAGPCSVDEDNIPELFEIATIRVKNRAGESKRAIEGARVVGLKSRTALDENGKGMGMDYAAFMENTRALMNGAKLSELAVPPSVEIAQRIVKETGMMVSTEIMEPLLQIPLYETRIPKGKLLLWNPAVDQLGWHVLIMAEFASRNGWYIGLKNPKWVGENLDVADSPAFKSQTTMEKTWLGLGAYAAQMGSNLIYVHRGVDVPEKGDYRNMPVHEIAKRVKLQAGSKLYFDPSHSYGPKMREDIVKGVIEAMQMKIGENEYLYDGILIEAGTSKTDTDQHISLKELAEMAQELARFRDLVSPV